MTRHRSFEKKIETAEYIENRSMKTRAKLFNINEWTVPFSNIQ